ncbi:rab-GTPase-TBC domain-containing protein [Scheffersomyces xylosifermentans]|uniref:rab-GTPase-TBC domain-containing protein n=1 Tax=Scheffersomyces xylosifermentans TaxID=1304137 RepID=UPI00315CCBDA
MIDYESLLEFEESLRSTAVTGSAILLATLETKIEMLRFINSSAKENVATELIVPEAQFEEADLEKLFDDYKFTEDEFTTCTKCGMSLTNPELYRSCCKAYIERKSSVRSKLEISYWLSLINSPTTTINTLPNYTEFLCLQQGIPSQLRPIIWQKLSLLNNADIPQSTRLVYKNFQHSYSAEVSKQINKDLNRTFPTVHFFREEATIKGLSTILNVYANYDVELGYCQGLLFLVGILFYQFKGDCELTLHALITVMESEPQLHDIFTTSTMSDTLNTWHREFLYILQNVDEDLYTHLTSFVELQAFLFQWWLSFISSHSPDLSIVNRVMDFCMLQGWKTGLFKISLGLLISNKPILMSLQKGDEEVIYQHLLNESKWGNVINDLDLFFGDLLLSWDEAVFLDQQQIVAESDDDVSLESNTIIDKFKHISINLRSLTNASLHSASSSSSSSSVRERADSTGQAMNQSSTSVFSHHHSNSNNSRNNEIESLYSDYSEASEGKSLTDYLKLPYSSKKTPVSEVTPEASNIQELKTENEVLRELLKKAYAQIDDKSPERQSLREEILEAIE